MSRAVCYLPSTLCNSYLGLISISCDESYGRTLQNESRCRDTTVPNTAPVSGTVNYSCSSPGPLSHSKSSYLNLSQIYYPRRVIFSTASSKPSVRPSVHLCCSISIENSISIHRLFYICHSVCLTIVLSISLYPSNSITSDNTV